MRAGESSAADVDTDVPPKRRRGRPRKSVQPVTEDDNTVVVEESEAGQDAADDATPVPIKMSRATSSKKTARFADVPEPVIEAMDDAPHMSPAGFEDLPIADTPIRTTSSKQLRARKGTPHAKKAVLVESEEDEGEGSDVLTPTSGEEDNEAQQPSEDLALPEEHQDDLFTPSETSAQSSEAGDDAPAATGDTGAGAQEFQAYEDADDEVQDGTKFAFDEGTTRMPDDTTVLDSENFSMISVDSLPSNAGRSSPPKPEETHNTTVPNIGSHLRHEYLRSSESPTSGSQFPITEGLTLPSSHSITGLSARPIRPTLSRLTTPVLDNTAPLAPPALEPVQPTVPKSQTPRLGRVVTAGVALQGLLDPTRLTPEPSQKALSEKRSSLDDLFRGFSEGTRKELQAGLRLGEQLAEGHSEEITPAASSPIKGQSTTAPKAGVFRTHRKYRQSRLLTPEDQDHVITPAGPVDVGDDVQYPTLNVEEAQDAPLSPARSENEMNWRVDTPSAAAASATQHHDLVETEQEEPAVEANKTAQHDDYADIWQEEASRSSNTAESEEVPAEKSPQLEDLFTDDGPVKPARGKLPRTWRRKNANRLHYSDEAESPQHSSPAHVEPAVSDEDEDDIEEAGEIVTPPLENLPMQDEDESTPGSEASDDTGMFFQSNMPNVFKGKRSSRFEMRQQRRQNTEKVTLSELLEQGESFVQESSPPATKKSSSTTKTNPFIDTPPRFPTLMSSPKKSSPLRRELRSSDIATSSPRYIEEEFTLPLAQSSPFRTIVDGNSALTTASDQRQFRVEMEGNTASTILRVREEANVYVDAYEPQERSLNEITEITEPSRTWHQGQSLLPSSPPKMQQSFTQSMLSARKLALERPEEPTVQNPLAELGAELEAEGYVLSSHADTPVSSRASSIAGVEPNKTPQRDPSLLTRISESLQKPKAPSPHPLFKKLSARLPKIEPWTKTHYKMLDKLYAMHIKHPAIFCASVIPPTPLSNTNGGLLRHFLASCGDLPYVGATFHAWGYEMLMTEELVVLCAVFMQLLTLEDIHEWEQTTGRRILMGDCAPGRTGERISGEEVLRRLATVVLGEAVRRDEREGVVVDRRRGLEVEWPRRGR
jgi:hypothetical protein